MCLPLFFTQNIVWDGDAGRGTAMLTGEDFRHIAKSLRMRHGEAVTASDGRGTEYLGTLAALSGESAEIALSERRASRGEPSVRVTLCVSMPKGDKLELVTQKAVELGAAAVWPVLTERSVARPDAKAAEKRVERLRRVALEAAKQCGRGVVPDVLPLALFEEALARAPGEKILFYEGGGAPLSALARPDTKEYTLFIGPEGGFAQEEVVLAEQSGAHTATLGPRILRAETAPLAALAILMHLTGNME